MNYLITYINNNRNYLSMKESNMGDLQNPLEIYLETCNIQTEFDYIFSVSLGKLPIHLWENTALAYF